MMMSLDDLVCHLSEGLPLSASDKAGNECLAVETVQLKLPAEWKIVENGELKGSLPRGRLATGFDPCMGRLFINFERQKGNK